jgi:hypothetical protein
MLGSTRFIKDNIVNIKGTDYVTVDDAMWAAEIARGIGARTGKYVSGVLKAGGVSKKTRIRTRNSNPS